MYAIHSRFRFSGDLVLTADISLKPVEELNLNELKDFISMIVGDIPQVNKINKENLIRKLIKEFTWSF